MSYTIAAAPDGKHIVIKVDGAITRPLAMEWTVAAHDLGRQLRIHRYLVDVTRAENREKVIDNYDFAYLDMQTEGIDRSARIAVLAAPGDNSHDFVATAAANAGLDFKLFTEREQAMRYLMADDDDAPGSAVREVVRPPAEDE
jgi:hypothetical protein